MLVDCASRAGELHFVSNRALGAWLLCLRTEVGVVLEQQSAVANGIDGGTTSAEPRLDLLQALPRLSIDWDPVIEGKPLKLTRSAH